MKNIIYCSEFINTNKFKNSFLINTELLSFKNDNTLKKKSHAFNAVFSLLKDE